jgi:hypothetical protein
MTQLKTKNAARSSRRLKRNRLLRKSDVAASAKAKIDCFIPLKGIIREAEVVKFDESARGE